MHDVTQTKIFDVAGISVSRGNVDRDPLNIDVRTYIRIHSILERIEAGEEVTLREEIAALALIERLRPKDTTSDEHTGSAIRKYESAFAAKSSTRGRKKVSRSPAPFAERSGDKLELVTDGDWLDEAGGNGGAEHDQP